MPLVEHNDVTLGRRLQAAVIVAHPDDEMLWCGGYILTHPEFHWRIITLCRASDPDRAPKFRKVLKRLGAEGEMENLDDEPEQVPISNELVQKNIVRLLAKGHYDLILTHGPWGEYTQHRRHQECCHAVVELWQSGLINTALLWSFAYEDGGRTHLPRVRDDADRRELLTEDVWLEKYRIITDVYGYDADSWEAQTTPREEGFWCFDSPQAAIARTGLWEQEL
jgi:LmbE family N-acetylglucosaminyl deacetylase